MYLPGRKNSFPAAATLLYICTALTLLSVSFPLPATVSCILIILLLSCLSSAV